ncbi:MAG: phosphodiesterase [Bacteroidetes bacterium]|jgi:alkaline phosphatase D|nr:phosphodiesterase [Bacteroidota bacterium]
MDSFRPSVRLLLTVCLVGVVFATTCPAPLQAQIPDTSDAPADPASAPPALQAGPMVGYGTHRTAAVWVQTTAPAPVHLRYWSVTPTDSVTARAGVIPDPDTSTTTPMITGRDGIGLIHLTDLEPGHTYRYQVFVDGSKVERPYPLEFQSQALWQWRTDPPAFDVAVGSCAYVNQGIYDRPGQPYGGEYEIFESIAAANPDVMLWTGDNTYLREVDWADPATMNDRYAHTRKLPELQALLGRTHHYATWDDHDYGPNNSDRSYPLKGAALDLFQRYWANPTYGLPDVPGVFGSFTWNDVEFFLMDNRYHRSPTTAPRDEDKTQWGQAQVQWLIDGLTSSTATFKVVVNGGQFLNPSTEHETLARFPADRERLLSAIGERGIEGVVLLSGDRHFSEMARMTTENADVDVNLDYPLYEITVSPLTAGSYDGSGEKNPFRMDGTLVTGERNYGILSFSGPRRNRTLKVTVYDVNGEQIWSRSIRARDLTVEE